MEHSQPQTGFQNFMSGYSLELFRQSFTERGGVLNEDDDEDAEIWLDKLLKAADDVFASA